MYSPLLQRYHALLWSKALPSGKEFTLTPGRVGSVLVLHHQSQLGSFVLSSDTIANSNRGKLRHFYEQMGSAANAAWHKEGGSIGGRLVFPRNRTDGNQTINQARGTHARIRDRFDLTLEAIRRHYLAEPSPLSETLGRYSDYFELFENFGGFVNFFLLQDLVTDDGAGVDFYIPFENYSTSPLPETFESYQEFRRRQLVFVARRNQRILRSNEVATLDILP